MAKRLLPRVNVKPTGVKLLLWGLVALISMNLLNRFNIVDVSVFQPDLLTLLAILFVSTEIGVMNLIRNRKRLDGLQWFGIVIIALAFAGLLTSWFGLTIAILNTAKGFVDLALLVFVVIEIFR